MSLIRTYSELVRLPTFEERFRYLRLSGLIGESTFGFDRYLNQALYTSQEWRRMRREIVMRDNGCDMAMPDYEIGEKIIVHHMNPLTIKDVEDRNDDIFNPEYLVCVSHNTHNAIHYGDEELLPKLPVERKPNDMCPWR